MKHRTLGSQGLEVSAIGLGTMGMTMAYGDASSEADAIPTIQGAYDADATPLREEHSSRTRGLTSRSTKSRALRTRRQRGSRLPLNVGSLQEQQPSRLAWCGDKGAAASPGVTPSRLFPPGS
jgi:hypothetical protein